MMVARATYKLKIGWVRSCTLATKPAAGVDETVLQVSQQLPTNVWSGIKYAKVTRSRCPAFQGPSLKMQQASWRPRRSHVLSRYKGERQVHKMSKTISICVYYANPLSNPLMHVCTKGPLRLFFKKKGGGLFRLCMLGKGREVGSQARRVSPGTTKGGCKSVCELGKRFPRSSGFFGGKQCRKQMQCVWQAVVPSQVCACLPLPL